jgi:hypothetical protein
MERMATRMSVMAAAHSPMFLKHQGSAKEPAPTIAFEILKKVCTALLRGSTWLNFLFGFTKSVGAESCAGDALRESLRCK